MRNRFLGGFAVWLGLGAVLSATSPRGFAAGDASPVTSMAQNAAKPVRSGESAIESLRITREGRTLALTYRPPVAGLRAPAAERKEAPRFTVYAGDQVVGSGQFEYG